MGDGTAVSKTGADLLGNRRFESISLQRASVRGWLDDWVVIAPNTAGSWRYLPRSMCSNAPTHADWSVDRTARQSGLRSAAVGASLSPPCTSRPADQPIRARESMSVPRWCRRCDKPRPWWRRRRAPRSPLRASRRRLPGDGRLDGGGPEPQRSRYVCLRYKNGLFVSSGRSVRTEKKSVRVCELDPIRGTTGH
jgi:hypothetical protein